jgi:hypothetical protein
MFAVIIYLEVATARLVKACIILTLILKHINHIQMRLNHINKNSVVNFIGNNHGLISCKEIKAKCRHLKILT